MNDLFRRLLPYTKPYKKALILSIIFALGVSMMTSLSLTILGPIIDRVILSGVPNPDAMKAEIERAAREAQAREAATARGETPEPQAAEEESASSWNPFHLLLDHFDPEPTPEQRVANARAFLASTPEEQQRVREEAQSRARYRLAFVPFALIIMYMLKGFCRYLQSYFIGVVGNRAVHDVRNTLYHHLIRMPTTFFTEFATGKLISRVITDTTVMQNAFSIVVKELVQNSFTLLGLVILVFSIDPVLAPLALIVLPLAIIPMVRVGKRLRGVSRRGQEGLSDMTDHLQETFSGARIVKAFGQEDRESERFKECTDRHVKQAIGAVRLSELASPIMETVSALGFALIIWFGGMRVIDGDKTAGDLFMLMAALGTMYTPIKGLGRVNNMLQKAMGAGDRVFEFLEMTNETARDHGTKVVTGLEDGLRFESVSFAYPETTKSALSNVSFAVQKGEIVALVGRSGGGKSTAANLLLRMHDPVTGRILLDGQDIQEFTLSSLRRTIGMVSQDVVLFDGNIRENIRYARPDAGDAEVQAAAEQAFAADFIKPLADGYDTEVGEKGVRLSGGQKQRLAIARTLLANPPILILDEATSALDSESEAMVQAAIGRAMEGRTTLVIAHRLSTIQNADRVVVLEKGEVVEEGTPDELMQNKDGIYHHLATLDPNAVVDQMLDGTHPERRDA